MSIATDEPTRAQTASPRVPCDIPPLARNAYYTGRLLTARDLRIEQQYPLDSMRLHELGLHGWGVAGGLVVTPNDACPAQRLTVAAGLAIDGEGRAIYVPAPIDVALPTKPAGDEPSHPPPDVGPVKCGDDTAALDQSQEGPLPPPEQLYVPPGAPCPPDDGEQLIVAIRYVECQDEWAPALYDECCQSGSARKPNRIRERFEIRAFRPADAPEGFVLDPRPEDCPQDDACDAIVRERAKQGPVTGGPRWLTLAVVSNFVPRSPVLEGAIDNWTYRATIARTSTIEAVIRCILDRIPTKPTTRITNFNWNHGNVSYSYEDFCRLATYEGFWVEFSRPVHSEGINSMTFQAVASHPGQAMIPLRPSKAELETNRTRARLIIDPHCLQHQHLCQGGFDVFITLKCNAVVDDQGVPVNGRLLARLVDGRYDVPKATDDSSLPGGLFESWFHVRGRKHS